MTNYPDISVIIPSYNEAENLRLILPALKQSLSLIDAVSEIIIVDTISPLDDTKQVCEDNDVIYKNREGDNHYGEAVRTGIRCALGEFIIFMDADGSHDPSFIPQLYLYRSDYDVVIASRYVEGGSTQNPPILIALSWLVNKIYTLVLRINCKDLSNSFKMYRASDLKKINLSCNNFDIVEEIIYKLSKIKKDLRIKEVPFRFNKRLYGKTKRNLFLFSITYIFTLIRLKFKK